MSFLRPYEHKLPTPDHALTGLQPKVRKFKDSAQNMARKIDYAAEKFWACVQGKDTTCIEKAPKRTHQRLLAKTAALRNHLKKIDLGSTFIQPAQTPNFNQVATTPRCTRLPVNDAPQGKVAGTNSDATTHVSEKIPAHNHISTDRSNAAFAADCTARAVHVFGNVTSLDLFKDVYDSLVTGRELTKEMIQLALATIRQLHKKGILTNAAFEKLAGNDDGANPFQGLTANDLNGCFLGPKHKSALRFALITCWVKAGCISPEEAQTAISNAIGQAKIDGLNRSDIVEFANTLNYALGLKPIDPLE